MWITSSAASSEDSELAVVTSGICKHHQVYLADGGLGFLLGDDALRYGRENIVETYYTAHVWRGLYIAPLLQHIDNPAITRIAGPCLCLRCDCIWNSRQSSP